MTGESTALARHAGRRRRAGVRGQTPFGPAGFSGPPPASGEVPVPSGSGRRIGNSVWPMCCSISM